MDLCSSPSETVRSLHVPSSPLWYLWPGLRSDSVSRTYTITPGRGCIIASHSLRLPCNHTISLWPPLVRVRRLLSSYVVTTSRSYSTVYNGRISIHFTTTVPIQYSCTFIQNHCHSIAWSTALSAHYLIIILINQSNKSYFNPEVHRTLKIIFLIILYGV